MKNILILLLILLPYFTSAQHQTENSSRQTHETVIYTCVMHPEIRMSKPGNCPKCGMKLIKKTIKSPSTSEAPSKDEDKKMPPAMGGMEHGNHDTGHNQTTSQNQALSYNTGEQIDMAHGKVVRYDLYVTDTTVSFTGKRKHAYAINGTIPAPTLVLTEGDTAEIYLHNMLKHEETSLHWHGVILPNQADGVPYLTTAPIKAGQTHLYRFPIVQNGTYWYHSHSGLQEQSGMYGALVFQKKNLSSKEMNGMPHMQMHEGHNMEMKGHFDREYTVVLSEWADERPTQIQRRLRTGNDWYSIKKGSTQSYSEAIRAHHFKTKVINEWKRMKAMDVSDVYYNRFLINGAPKDSLPDFKAGTTVKLRVVNAGASSYFWLGYGGGKITVVGNDGNDIDPVDVDRLIIAPAETYDLLVSIPQRMSYEFRATPEDRTGAASIWLGSGMRMPAPALPRLKYFEGMKMMNDMMRTNGTMKDMDMNMHNQVMDMNTVMYPEITGYPDDNKKGTSATNVVKDTSKSMRSNAEGQDMNMSGMDHMHMSSGDITTLNYDMFHSPVKTNLPDGPTKVLHFTLTGNMNRYVWTLDNKTVKESDRIMIKKGENVRMIVTNNSMMRHPMHLHGHDFRVINSETDFSPLKNVIDIMPMETDTLEFAANQNGNWFFHCHILFHMMAGMGRVFRYENSTVNPELPDAEKAYQIFRRRKEQNMKHLMIRAGLESNGSDGEAMISTNRAALQETWHLGLRPEHGYESETNIGRYFGTNQWWFAYAGFDYHYKVIDPSFENGHAFVAKNIFGDESTNMFGQTSNKADRKTVMAGIQYTLPLLFLADFRVDGNGKLRFQVSREDIPVTKRLRFNIMINSDKEYAAGFRYIVSKWFALSTHYDSDMGLGAGATLTY